MVWPRVPLASQLHHEQYPFSFCLQPIQARGDIGYLHPSVTNLHLAHILQRSYHLWMSLFINKVQSTHFLTAAPGFLHLKCLPGSLVAFFGDCSELGYRWHHDRDVFGWLYTRGSWVDGFFFSSPNSLICLSRSWLDIHFPSVISDRQLWTEEKLSQYYYKFNENLQVEIQVLKDEYEIDRGAGVNEKAVIAFSRNVQIKLKFCGCGVLFLQSQEYFEVMTVHLVSSQIK